MLRRCLRTNASGQVGIEDITLLSKKRYMSNSEPKKVVDELDDDDPYDDNKILGKCMSRKYHQNYNL